MSAIVNSDDAYGKQLAGWRSSTITYGLESARGHHDQKISAHRSLGLTFTAETPNGKVQVASLAGGAD